LGGGAAPLRENSELSLKYQITAQPAAMMNNSSKKRQDFMHGLLAPPARRSQRENPAAKIQRLRCGG
jgi:hypothetical protein